MARSASLFADRDEVQKTDYICTSEESERPAPDTLDETLPYIMKKNGKIIFSIAIIIIECFLLFIYIEDFVYYVNNIDEFHFGTEVVDKSGILFINKYVYQLHLTIQVIISFIILFCLFLKKRKLLTFVLLLQFIIIIIIAIQANFTIE